MRNKSILILSALITAIVIGVLALWLNTPSEPRKLPRHLTPMQRKCIDELVGNATLAFVESQYTIGSVAVGYLADKGYYTSIIGIDPNGNCHIDFHAQVFRCFDEYHAQYCQGSDYRVEPRRIQQIELTGDFPPDVYVWFDVLGMGSRDGAHHLFFVGQADGSAKPILTLRLCVGLSSLGINTANRMISAVDDVVCDTFSGRKEHIDYSLAGGTATKLSDWFDP
jgi:hypothetical protein